MKQAMVWVLLATMVMPCVAAEKKTFPLRYAADISKELGQPNVYLGGYGIGPSSRPQTIKAEPKWKSETPLYFAVMWKGLDPGVVCVLDESQGTGKGYDTLYADSNGDLDLTNEKPCKGETRGNEERGSTDFGGVAMPLKTAAGITPLHVRLTLERYKSPDGSFAGHLGVQPMGCFASEVKLDRAYKVVFAESRLDGAFSSVADMIAEIKQAERGSSAPQPLYLGQADTMFVDINGDGRIDARWDSPERLPCGVCAKLGGKLVRIGLSDDLQSIVVEEPELKMGTLTLAEPVVEAKLVSADVIVTIPRGEKQITCPAGEYYLLDCKLSKADAKATWLLEGRGSTAFKPVIVEPDKTAEVALGGPLRPLIEVRSFVDRQDGIPVVQAGTEAYLALVILGKSNEIYAPPPSSIARKSSLWGLISSSSEPRQPEPPAFVVTDAKGNKIDSGKFQYG
jgi:hypothetical protein